MASLCTFAQLSLSLHYSSLSYLILLPRFLVLLVNWTVAVKFGNEFYLNLSSFCQIQMMSRLLQL